MSSLKFLEELSKDYEKLFDEEKDYDVIIYAGKEPNLKELHAHSYILYARSQHNDAFSKEFAEEKDGKFIFRKPNIEPNLLTIILR